MPIEKTEVLCKDCSLWRTAKTNCMKASGSPHSRILLIGEAPGHDEDLQGKPFVGKSGRLLRDALKSAGLSDEDFIVTNVVRCHPFIVTPEGRRKDRPPTQEEADACKKYLFDDIARMSNLELVVCIGNISLRTLTGKQKITKVSGEAWEWKDKKLMPLMHPSYVLQNQAQELDRFFDHVARIPRILDGGLSDGDDFGEYVVIKDWEMWKEFIDKLKEQGVFSYDTETTGLQPKDEDSYIKSIQFSFDLKKAYTLPLTIWTPDEFDEIIGELEAIFRDKSIGKVGQNIKFDNLWMWSTLGILVRGTIWDTQLAEYLLVGKGSIGLKDIAYKYSRMGGYEKLLPDNPSKTDGEELWRYGAIDADLTHRAYHQQKPVIHSRPSQERILKTLLVPVSDVLWKMEHRGIRIDIDKIKEADRECEIVVGDLKKSMSRLPEIVEFERSEEKEFNPNSHKQLSYILYKICGLDIIKKTAKSQSPSTDQEVLKHYASSNELCRLLLDYSSYNQMRKTFFPELIENERNGRIHTTLWLTEAATGRTSSRKPNLQNIPKGEKDIFNIRQCFLADPGYSLVEVDLNQHELRVMAETAGDRVMLEALQGDIHSATASAIFGPVPGQEISDDRRREAKSVNFGVIYGQTAHGLSQQLGIPIEEAELWIFRFMEKYYATHKWMDHIVQFCKKKGYVESLSGRVRFFPSWEEFDTKKINEIINFPIQATASDILLYGAIAVDKLLQKRKSFLVLEIHDSLLLNIHKDEMNILPEIKEVMTTYFKKFINFKSDVKVDIKAGQNWKDLEEV